MYRKLNRTAERIEAVLRERRAAASVVGGRVLPGFVEMLLRPEPGTKVSQVKALQADIALAVGNSNIRIAQSGTHLAIQIGRESRQPVRLTALMSQLDQTPRYTAVLGLAEDGAPLLARLSAPDVAHALIAGTTGSGKTSLAHTALISLCRTHRPYELGVVVIDPKCRDEFARAVERHLLLPPARTPDEAVSALAKVVAAMERRVAQLDPLPRIVVYVDELADLCQSGGAALIDPLTRIAQRGRESGIHLLACTQKPSAKAIGPLLKANLPLRLVGRVTSIEDARVASGIAGSGAEKLTGAGDFLAVAGGRTIRFQAALPI
ncbi:MAG: DNA translocase FtsK [Anaerolineae bacterium]|nr:DNA translocase FtsK [Thermoflexales bacterium]MDW8408881.1 DNA translocase FtsK [Anaerolineae bacterium]